MRQSEILKFFEVGESVRVISGTHTGESGIITQIEGKHAVLMMDSGAVASSQVDGVVADCLKILLSNLKAKTEDMEHVKLLNYIQKSVIENKYQAGEMVKFKGPTQT